MSDDHAAAADALVREASDSGNPGRLVADSVEACLAIARTSEQVGSLADLPPV